MPDYTNLTNISKTQNSMTLKQLEQLKTVTQERFESKYQQLGGEAGFLGQPTTGICPTSNHDGLYQHFQGGSLYSHGNQIVEIHGAIRDKWAELGWERSFLGYPISNETDFPENGKVSVFEHGSIYWWADTGAIELNDVVVHYTGIVCFGETNNDQLSDSDEPYVVMGVINPKGALAFRSRVYEDVDGGESRPDLIEIYRGNPHGLTISTVVMEHDEEDPDKYKAAMQAAVGAAFTGVTALIALIPVVGAVFAAAAGLILPVVTPTVSTELNRLLDMGDDQIGETTLVITAKQMIILAARTVNFEERGVGFKLATPLLSGLGASYKAYFGIVPA